MSQKDILLCTFNSTYQHSSFGLRYLYANLNELQPRCQIIETTIKETPRNFIEKILAYKPQIVGFSVYIWNTLETLEAIMILKKVAPEIIIVLGGPEISYETEKQEHTKWCNYIIKGEADFAFYELCVQLLNSPVNKTANNLTAPTWPQIQQANLPDIKQIVLPYRFYTDEDIKNRIVYVEASRGCPYKCEYCLSSLDKSVRSFDLELFLSEMQLLLDRGVRTFKFVDRTFNLSPSTSTQILKFFLEKINLDLFLHFELVPDRLPVEIRDLIKQFPAGSLQFEVGIQTLNPLVAQNVSRKNDLNKVIENFKFIREHTHVHTHADLIVGLPGETLESFAAGFDQLASYGPDEIQVGILKRLKGTPIARHEVSFKMIYSDLPPYQILSTNTMNFETLQTMNRFAKFWDLYANSGDFKNFMLWLQGNDLSLFNSFMNLTQFLSLKFNETHSISLLSLTEQAWHYLLKHNVSEAQAEEIILNDYSYGTKKRDIPIFLKKQNNKNSQLVDNSKKLSLNQRQLKHLQ